MEKSELRYTVKILKKGFPTKELEEQSHDIVSRLEREKHFLRANIVLIYHALPDEVQTAAIIERWYKKKTILLPKIVGKELTLHIYNGEKTLQTGAFNIKEPTTPPFIRYDTIDLAIIPGIAFDLSGHRLGRGGGYYDRLLGKMLPYNVYKIGLAFSFQIFDNVPTESTDVNMDSLVY